LTNIKAMSRTKPYLFLLISTFLLISFVAAETTAQEGDLSEEVIEQAEEKTDIELEDPRDLDFEIELRNRLHYLIWYLNGLKGTQDLTAQSVMVNEIDPDGESQNILSVGSNRQYPIASLTKLMSSVVARENLVPEDEVILNRQMLATYGSSPALFLGSRVRIEDLVKVSLIQSTNDASEALARSLPDGKFVELMNNKAQEIGMENTVFRDAHGLDPENVSTVADISRLKSYISDNHSDIWTITCDDNFRLPGPQGQLMTFMNLNNRMEWDNFLGGKTGYLPEAGHTYTALFEIEDRTYSITLLKSEDRWEDTQKIKDWLKEDPR